MVNVGSIEATFTILDGAAQAKLAQLNAQMASLEGRGSTIGQGIGGESPGLTALSGQLTALGGQITAVEEQLIALNEVAGAMFTNLFPQSAVANAEKMTATLQAANKEIQQMGGLFMPGSAYAGLGQLEGQLSRIGQTFGQMRSQVSSLKSELSTIGSTMSSARPLEETWGNMAGQLSQLKQMQKTMSEAQYSFATAPRMALSTLMQDMSSMFSQMLGLNKSALANYDSMWNASWRNQNVGLANFMKSMDQVPMMASSKFGQMEQATTGVFSRMGSRFSSTLSGMVSATSSATSQISNFFTKGLGASDYMLAIFGSLMGGQLFDYSMSRAISKQMLYPRGDEGREMYSQYQKYTIASSASDYDINRMFQYVMNTPGLQATDTYRALSSVQAASYSSDPTQRLRDMLAYSRYLQGGWDATGRALMDEGLSPEQIKMMKDAKTPEERMAALEEIGKSRHTMDAQGRDITTQTTGPLGAYNATLAAIDNLMRGMSNAFDVLMEKIIGPVAEAFNTLDESTRNLIGMIVTFVGIGLVLISVLKILGSVLSPVIDAFKWIGKRRDGGDKPEIEDPYVKAEGAVKNLIHAIDKNTDAHLHESDAKRVAQNEEEFYAKRMKEKGKKNLEGDDDESRFWIEQEKIPRKSGYDYKRGKTKPFAERGTTDEEETEYWTRKKGIPQDYDYSSGRKPSGYYAPDRVHARKQESMFVEGDTITKRAAQSQDSYIKQMEDRDAKLKRIDLLQEKLEGGTKGTTGRMEFEQKNANTLKEIEKEEKESAENSKKMRSDTDHIAKKIDEISKISKENQAQIEQDKKDADREDTSKLVFDTLKDDQKYRTGELEFMNKNANYQTKSNDELKEMLGKHKDSVEHLDETTKTTDDDIKNTDGDIKDLSKEVKNSSSSSSDGFGGSGRKSKSKWSILGDVFETVSQIPGLEFLEVLGGVEAFNLLRGGGGGAGLRAGLETGGSRVVGSLGSLLLDPAAVGITESAATMGGAIGGLLAPVIEGIASGVSGYFRAEPVKEAGGSFNDIGTAYISGANEFAVSGPAQMQLDIAQWLFNNPLIMDNIWGNVGFNNVSEMFLDYLKKNWPKPKEMLNYLLPTLPLVESFKWPTTQEIVNHLIPTLPLVESAGPSPELSSGLTTEIGGFLSGWVEILTPGFQDVWGALGEVKNAFWELILAVLDIFVPVQNVGNASSTLGSAFASIASPLAGLGANFGGLNGAVGAVTAGLGAGGFAGTLTGINNNSGNFKDVIKRVGEFLAEWYPYIIDFLHWLKWAADRLRELALFIKGITDGINEFNTEIHNFKLSDIPGLVLMGIFAALKVPQMKLPSAGEILNGIVTAVKGAFSPKIDATVSADYLGAGFHAVDNKPEGQKTTSTTSSGGGLKSITGIATGGTAGGAAAALGIAGLPAQLTKAFDLSHLKFKLPNFTPITKGVQQTVQSIGTTFGTLPTHINPALSGIPGIISRFVNNPIGTASSIVGINTGNMVADFWNVLAQAGASWPGVPGIVISAVQPIISIIDRVRALLGMGGGTVSGGTGGQMLGSSYYGAAGGDGLGRRAAGPGAGSLFGNLSPFTENVLMGVAKMIAGTGNPVTNYFRSTRPSMRGGAGMPGGTRPSSIPGAGVFDNVVPFENQTIEGIENLASSFFCGHNPISDPVGAFMCTISKIMGTMSYDFYFNHKQNSLQTHVGNCMDLAQAVIDVANVFHLGGSQVAGYWGSTPHNWASIQGVGNLDPTSYTHGCGWSPSCGRGSAGPSPTFGAGTTHTHINSTEQTIKKEYHIHVHGLNELEKRVRKIMDDDSNIV